MPVIEQDKSAHKIHPGIKAGLVLLALVIVGGIGWGLWQWRLDLDTGAYQQAVKDDTLYRNAGTPEKAVAEWDKYRAGLPPKQYIYSADLYEGALLETMQNYPAALKIYHDAEVHRTGNGTGEVEGIARIAEMQKDYPTAIKYYQKVEQLYEALHPGGSEVGWTKHHIEQLQAEESANAAK